MSGFLSIGPELANSVEKVDAEMSLVGFKSNRLSTRSIIVLVVSTFLV